ncbi:MAG: hypothetical protein ACKOXB_04795 [Flavobacteriales bacterium]
MERIEFLKLLWRKAFKPILILLTVIWFIQFLLNAYIENGAERLFVFLILIILIVFLVAHFTGEIFRSALRKIKLSDGMKTKLEIARQLGNYFVSLALGASLYMLWKEDIFLVCIFLGAILIDKISSLSVKAE